jgi:hypothetical protein
MISAALRVDERDGPDLRELVLAHGGWDRVTPEAWADFDRKRAHWQAWVAAGGLHTGRGE